jgi:phosphonate transport system substrate-binding protein
MTTKNTRDTLTLILGAVAYDPKVVTIWEGFQAWFARRGLAFDTVLYTNYERQVEAHLRGDIDVAWNSPLAWLETQLAAPARGRRAEAIAMRDTDQDLTSLILVRADGPRTLAELRGMKVGVGAGDSPQATLFPLADLAGIPVDVVRHDVLVGKHGDHIGGERDAARALVAGTVDAACVLDGNHLAFTRDGTLPAGAVRVLHQTGRYDHCNFTVLDDAPAAAIATFRELLLGMSYEDPEVRPLLDLEGLKAWRPGRTSGYALLERAVATSGYLEPWLAQVRAR